MLRLQADKAGSLAAVRMTGRAARSASSASTMASCVGSCVASCVASRTGDISFIVARPSPRYWVSVRAGAPAHLHGERFARPGPLITHEGRGTHRGGDRATARARRKRRRALALSERAAHRHDHVVLASCLKLLGDAVAYRHPSWRTRPTRSSTGPSRLSGKPVIALSATGTSAAPIAAAGERRTRRDTRGAENAVRHVPRADGVRARSPIGI